MLLENIQTRILTQTLDAADENFAIDLGATASTRVISGISVYVTGSAASVQIGFSNTAAAGSTDILFKNDTIGVGARQTVVSSNAQVVTDKRFVRIIVNHTIGHTVQVVVSYKSVPDALAAISDLFTFNNGSIAVNTTSSIMAGVVDQAKVVTSLYLTENGGNSVNANVIVSTASADAIAYTYTALSQDSQIVSGELKVNLLETTDIVKVNNLNTSTGDVLYYISAYVVEDPNP